LYLGAVEYGGEDENGALVSIFNKEGVDKCFSTVVGFYTTPVGRCCSTSISKIYYDTSGIF
jgi:hypothetical protein